MPGWVQVFWDVTLLSGECFGLLMVSVLMRSQWRGVTPTRLESCSIAVRALSLTIGSFLKWHIWRNSDMCVKWENCMLIELWNRARNACNRVCILWNMWDAVELFAIMRCRCCMFIGLHLLISTQAGLHANWSLCKQNVLVAIYVQFLTTKQGLWFSVPAIRFYGMIWDYEESREGHEWETVMVENIRKWCLGASQSCSHIGL